MTPTPGKTPRYVKRLLEMAGNDPQLQELLPDATVEDALRQPGLSYEQLIATVLDGYAERPALGERDCEIVPNPSTGRHQRKHLPRFQTITYYELHSRIKGLANTWRHHEQHHVAPR